MREYYDRRAGEYDDTSYGSLDDEQADEARAVDAVVAALSPARVLDVGCGTGMSTSSLRGRVVGLDASERMLRLARRRLPQTSFVRAVVPPLPFADGSFDRVHASHLYGHLDRPADRRAFVQEAGRVAGTLVVVDAARHGGMPAWEWEERTIGADGSAWRVFKRSFEPEELLGELGGRGAVLFGGRWFLAVSVSLTS